MNLVMMEPRKSKCSVDRMGGETARREQELTAALEPFASGGPLPFVIAGLTASER